MAENAHEVFEQESTVAQWDDDYYHPIAIPFYDRAVADMLHWMGAKKGDTVLDAGCGPGVHSIRAAQLGYRVCAIDISTTMLRHARERVQQARLLDRVEFRQEDLTNLTFPDSSFRSVFSWGVIIHIPEAEKGLDELARILQPGGRLALYLTNMAALDHKIESLTRVLVNKRLEGLRRARMGDSISYGSDDERLFVWRFDAEALTQYLANRGLFLVRRHIGELSHIQRRLRGLPRKALLHLNNFAYRLGVPPCLGTCNLYIFEKGSSG